jgi:hypothetical protein
MLLKKTGVFNKLIMMDGKRIRAQMGNTTQGERSLQLINITSSAKP